MVYGVPGIGKTTLASQMPRPVAILDIEGASGWLYDDLEGVDIYTIEPDEDIGKEVEAFLKAAVTGKGNAANYRSIAIDTVSALRSRYLQQIVGNSLFYEIGDYGVVKNWFRRVLTFTQFCPQMIMWVNQMKEDEDGPRKVIRPAGLSEASMNDFNELLDAIVFMGRHARRVKSTGGTGEEVASERFLMTDETDPDRGRIGIMAKDRTGFLPGYLDLPEMGEDGNPPQMFKPFFDEIIKELGYNRAPRKTKSK
jgi:phage nucleotide-binding protein